MDYELNEPVETYAPTSPRRDRVIQELAELQSHSWELGHTIGGVSALGFGAQFSVVQPHDHQQQIGVATQATVDDARRAIEAAEAAAPAWQALGLSERIAIFQRAAELLAGPWREKIVAATILGQSKTVYQAEIDAACELIDFWRYNCAFAQEIQSHQPHSSSRIRNAMDHRPLEGFVYAVTPFNFTAIAANLATAPALMGNVVIWKPAPTQQLAAHLSLRLMEAAGLPPGVINLLAGDGQAVSEVVLTHPNLAGIHFTGSTATFRYLWQEVGSNISRYRSYPRLVGEAGGKDFVLAHHSADPETLITALLLGAFEYSGQKCSAASRAYIPQSLWEQIRRPLAERAAALAVGDPRDFKNFTGAVIDEKSFTRISAIVHNLANDPDITPIVIGSCKGDRGYFVTPTIVESSHSGHDIFTTEYFAPILAVHPYPDSEFDATAALVSNTSDYGLTGAVIAQDRYALTRAANILRFAAGNLYLNDKPTGAVVGHQPFGGGRASGTNDKAGSMYNLLRWVSPRVIKENYLPPTSTFFPSMG